MKTPMNTPKSRKSPRAQWWDYSRNGAYFITICTKNRKHYFGKIDRRQMELSKVGVLADVFWHEIKHHAKGVKLDAFVVMPNHIHGILILDKITESPTTSGSTMESTVGTGNALSLPSYQPLDGNGSPIQPGKSRFPNKGKNTVSSIIGSYKAAVSKHARRLGYEFAWQLRFHDHIIRDDKSFYRIANYIKNNPKKWEEDRFN